MTRTCEAVEVDDEGRMVECEDDGEPVRQDSTGMTITACPTHADELASEADPTAAHGPVHRLLDAARRRLA